MKDELRLICLKVKSFPVGIKDAFIELEQKIGGPGGRTFYGLSRGDKTGILYWACVLARDGENFPSGCEQISVQPGTYMSETLSNWRSEEKIIGQTFQEMLDHPKLDPQGYCVEKYLENGDVICMVRLLV